MITKHDASKAVLISIAKYASPEATINSVSAEFDFLLLRMQRPGARRGMQKAFHASPKQLGRVAVSAARKRS